MTVAGLEALVLRDILRGGLDRPSLARVLRSSRRPRPEARRPVPAGV